MNTRPTFAIGLLLLAVVTCAGDQIPATSAADPEVASSSAQPVFRSSTNLVQVPVVVRDRTGHAVGNLGAEDFQLFDSGKLQVISRFSAEKFDSTETLQTRSKSQAPADTSTPAIAPAELPNRFVALLLDDANLESADFIHARDAALHFISTIHPDERVAVITTSGKTPAVFTNDQDQLRKTLLSINSLARKKFYDSVTDEKLKPCPLSPFIADLITNTGRMMTTPCLADDGIVKAQASDLLAKYADPDDLAYFRAVTNLIEKMSGMPGQRAILLASPGMYVPKRFERQLTGVLAEAIRSKVVISGVDPRGVLGSGEMVAGGATRLPGSKLDRLEEEQQREAFMEDITAGTGGTYSHGNNDLDGALKRADSVPEFVYLLAFSPTNIKFDGLRHELKVTLKNPRGLTVVARSGYFADGYTEDPADQVRQQIQEAFFSNQDLMGLPVRLQTQFFKDGDNTTLTVSARVDASKLPFRKEDGRNRDDLTLVVGLFDQNGNFVAAYQKTIEMRLKDENLSAWMRSGIENSTDFTVKPGKYLVRLVVRDSEGSSMAEQSTGVEIPW